MTAYAADVKDDASKHYTRFVDSTTVKFIGGKGGDGCISMMHLFANELAGPDGGNGGNGGHIVLRADKRVKSLMGLSKTYQGLAGERGHGKHMYGKCADHIFVNVPVGTMVAEPRPSHLAEHEFDPEKSDIVAELDQDGSMFLAARGGAGGRGNASYLTDRNRKPRIAQAGAGGERQRFELRLRIYAHVGLIGLPNVGKSTLLKTMTNAHVKIGNYAFTTLHPQVGVIGYDDYTQIAISDLPGLIYESHKNRGLGLQFLRHVQRCLCLLYVIDLNIESSGLSAVQQLETLLSELEHYRKGLSERPHIVIGNKIDAPGAEQQFAELTAYVRKRRPDTTVLSGSSLTGRNLATLREHLRIMYDAEMAKHADDPRDAYIW